MARFKVKTKERQLIVKAKFTSNEKIDEKEFRDFSRKCIRGFFKAVLKSKLGSKYIEYTGPVGISLQEQFKNPISQYDFFFIVEQVVDILQKAEKFNLNSKKILFNVSNIYINEITKEMQFIYMPLITEQTDINLMEFLGNFVYLVHPTPEQSTDYLSRFSYFLAGMPVFDGEQIEAYIKYMYRSIIDIIKKHGAGNSGFMTDKQQDYYAHYNSEEATGLLMEEDEETEILSASVNMHFPVLYRENTGESIVVNKTVFRLGKENGSADYVITGNSAVSRKHADIIMRNGEYVAVHVGDGRFYYIGRELNGHPESCQDKPHGIPDRQVSA